MEVTLFKPYKPLWEIAPTPDTIRLVSWNVLADKFISKKDVAEPMSVYLKESLKRKEAVEDVIKGLEADLFCLQEVENYGEWYGKMFKAGYQGIYSPRPSRGLTTENSTGVAIFYSIEKFDAHSLKLFDFNSIPNPENAEEPLNNSGCVIALARRTNSRKLVIGNFHATRTSGPSEALGNLN
jgi:mRNA deadenylase 3'-5' endonuclease subunit Ccr4